MSDIYGLIEVLQRENEIYAALISVSERKRPLIVSGDTDALGAMLGEEAKLAGEARALEEKRIAVSEALGKQYGLNRDKLCVSALAGCLPDPALSEKLQRAKAALTATLARLAHYNKTNRALLKQRSDYNAALLSAIFSRAEPQGSFYDSRGSAGSYNTGAGFFDRQV